MRRIRSQKLYINNVRRCCRYCSITFSLPSPPPPTSLLVSMVRFDRKKNQNFYNEQEQSAGALMLWIERLQLGIVSVELQRLGLHAIWIECRIDSTFSDLFLSFVNSVLFLDWDFLSQSRSMSVYCVSFEAISGNGETHVSVCIVNACCCCDRCGALSTCHDSNLFIWYRHFNSPSEFTVKYQLCVNKWCKTLESGTA